MVVHAYSQQVGCYMGRQTHGIQVTGVLENAEIQIPLNAHCWNTRILTIHYNRELTPGVQVKGKSVSTLIPAQLC